MKGVTFVEFENKDSENAVYHYNPDFDTDIDAGFDPDEYREESDYEYDPVKRTVNYDYTELTALEQYLENAEKEGLRLREFNRNKFYFEKSEPRTVRYSCVVFKDESRSDGLNKEFVELCKGAGWKLAAFDKEIDELYIFRTLDKNADPIMTDDRQTLSFAARKNVKRNIIEMMAWPLFYLSFVMVDVLSDVSLGKFTLFNSENITDLAILLMWLISLAFLTTFFLCWYTKQKRHIDRNERIEFLDIRQAEKQYRIKNAVYSCGCMLLFGVYIYFDGGYFDTSYRAVCSMFFSLPAAIFVYAALTGKGFDLPLYHYRKRRALAALGAVCVFAAVSAVSMLTGSSLSASVKDKMLTKEEALVSVSDFGCDKQTAKDSFDCDATRFFQKYTVISYCADDACENDVWEIRYQVFVSDSPSMRNHYIENAVSDMEYKNTIKLDKSDEKWDEVYYCEYKDGVTGEIRRVDRMTVKGNTVIYPTYLPDSEAGAFFDLLYSRLFTN